MQWQEYRGQLPHALAGLGAVPMHHEDAWWMTQSLGAGARRVLRFPTLADKASQTPDVQRWAGIALQPRDGAADQEGFPGVDLAGKASQTPDQQRWAGIASKASQTPDQQRWAGIASKATQTPDQQRWAGIAGSGFGDVAAFNAAASDLNNQVALPIQAGDTYAQNGETDQALSSYKAAGQVAASTLGPEIDAAGAPQVTQRYTQYAWALNGQLAASTDAGAAGGLAHQILVTLQDAIAEGQNALSAPTPTTTSDLLAAAQALKAYLDANGVPPQTQKLVVVGTFQQAYVDAGNSLKYGVDQRYGPATAAALAKVLGTAPNPQPGPAPSPSPTPPPSPGPTPTAPTTAASDYTVPILFGAGVIGIGLVTAAGWSRYRKRRRAA